MVRYRGEEAFHNLMIKSQSFKWPVSLGCDIYMFVLASLPPPLNEMNAAEAGRVVGYSQRNALPPSGVRLSRVVCVMEKMLGMFHNGSSCVVTM